MNKTKEVAAKNALPIIDLHAGFRKVMDGESTQKTLKAVYDILTDDYMEQNKLQKLFMIS